MGRGENQAGDSLRNRRLYAAWLHGGAFCPLFRMIYGQTYFYGFHTARSDVNGGMREERVHLEFVKTSAA